MYFKRIFMYMQSFIKPAIWQHDNQIIICIRGLSFEGKTWEEIHFQLGITGKYT